MAIVKADYSQIELRIVAESANDQEMKKVFMEGKDLHILTRMHITVREAPEDVSSDERQLAMALNYGLIYGMGAKAWLATREPALASRLRFERLLG